MSEHVTTWWSPSRGRTRGTRVAATAIVAALLAVSTIVWISPQDSPSRLLLSSAVSGFDPVAALRTERDDLAQQTLTLEASIAQRDEDSAALEQQLEDLQASLEASNDALAQARAENDRLTAPSSPSPDDADADGSPAGSDSGDAASGASGASGSGSSTPGSAGSGSSGSGSGSGSGNGAGSGSSGGGSSAPSPSPGPSPTPSPSPTTPEITAPSLASLVQPENDYYGLYTQQAPFNWATYDDTASRVGLRSNVVGFFAGWDQDFRATAIERAWQRNTLPIMTWESRPIAAANDQVDEPEYSLPRIIDGEYDDYLRQWARDVVETGLPFGLRLNHEMNGVWYPWSEVTGSGQPINGNNRGDYVRMWQHVYDIFEEEGANELVFWIWAPNIVNNLPGANQSQDFTASYYPGDSYVDWVGLSGYLRPPYRQNAEQFTFDYTFGRSLDQLRELTDKPIFLAEIGASETGGTLANGQRVPDGHKGRWITSMFEAMADPANDDVVGFAWFNLAVTTYVEGTRSTNDWRIESRRDSLAAFREGLQDPENHFRLQPY